MNTIHTEKHFTSKEFVRDVIIGMADGLTVPFALAAGLSGVVSHNTIIMTAVFAEIAAGSISMGLGGYLAAKNEYDHYFSEKQREMDEVKNMPEKEKAEVLEIFESYGLTKEATEPIIKAFESNPISWVNFMMKNELNLEEPDKHRAKKSSITIALAYVAGGIIPLGPYLLLNNTTLALFYSSFFTILALLIFGYIKSKIIGLNPLNGALRTAGIGSLAAATAYLIANIIS